MLEYRTLETFATVILEGGFDKAARKLHLTQSAVSQRVRLLEEQHGQILLQRSTPPQPTEAGLPLLYHYRKVKQLEDDLLMATVPTKDDAFNSVAIAVNADTLATWLYPVLAGLLDRYRLVLDLQVDDQDATHHLMQSGHVWGCISTRPDPLQGCGAERLGGVRYAMFSTTLFRDRWFPAGLSEERLALSPMARYNRKDDLNSQIFAALEVTPIGTPPTFYIPSSEMYGHFVSESRCWGVLPEQQSEPLEREGRIVNLSPPHWVEVVLYWHCWNLKSDLMADFSRRFVAEARRCLRSA
jgi:LysR family transcriptional regulator (chromosome initiation inhibitor)